MTHTISGPWTAPYGLPDYSAIKEDDFVSAIEAAMIEDRSEIEAIKGAGPVTFANTIEALERSGQALSRACSIFYTKVSSDTTSALQEMERTVGPKLAAHGQATALDRALWERVKSVSSDGLTPEQARVLELTRRWFKKSGADLDEAGRARLREITQELSKLGTQFSQTVLEDEQTGGIVLSNDDLEGLPDWLVDAAKRESLARNASGPVITVSRSMAVPFLQSSPHRHLREQLWRAWTARGEEKNWPVIARTLQLRQETAQLLGYATFADMRLEHQMAGAPDRVDALLKTVWAPAHAKALADQAALEELLAADGINGPLAPWDWQYYAEQQRQALHSLSDAELKPYLSLDNMITAAFDVASKLFGLSFKAIEPDIALPHPDARGWEVWRGEQFVGLFVGDYFARSSKRSGAWASTLRGQQKLWEPGTPIVLNTCNFVQGSPTLLSWDDARTLFHEFGHALHMLLSDVTYPSVSGTNVARDFVELPSQLYEHWLGVTDVLAAHARHHETGASMPAELIERVKAAETFGQGFGTVEYLASAIVDLAMHTTPVDENTDMAELERSVLADIGMPSAIVMRHRSPHFLHIFAGSGYASGYYSYLWSEVMDADAFQAFEQAGDVFDPETAGRLATHIYSAGGVQEAQDAYIAFRGAMPGPQALLEGRGLA